MLKSKVRIVENFKVTTTTKAVAADWLTRKAISLEDYRLEYGWLFNRTPEYG